MFVDHMSGFLNVELQVGFSSTETIRAKQNFEQLAGSHGVTIQSYLADNGTFKAHSFERHIRARRAILEPSRALAPQPDMADETKPSGTPPENLCCLCTMEDITLEDGNYGALFVAKRAKWKYIFRSARLPLFSQLLAQSNTNPIPA